MGFVDRGGDSKKIAQHFLDGEKNGAHIAVMGNHEVFFINYLKIKHMDWLKKNKIKLNYQVIY